MIKDRCNHDYHRVFSKVEYFNYEKCSKCGHVRKEKRNKKPAETVELWWW